MNRYKFLRIPSETFLGLFTEGDHPGYCVVKDAIPKDAKIASVCELVTTCMIEIILESESFPEVPLGKEIPTLNPRFTIIPKETP